jgi:hypothetical protein
MPSRSSRVRSYCACTNRVDVKVVRFSFLQKRATVRWKSLPTAPALPVVSVVSRAGGLAFTHLSEEIDECTGRLVDSQ